MNALLVSDLHFALRLPMAKVDPGNVSSDRLRDVAGIVDQVAETADRGGYDLVVVAGDLFDQQRPDGATLVAASRALANLCEVCDVYLLPGNHDAQDRDGRLYSLQMYSELDVPNLHVLGHETVQLTEGLLLHAVPWLPEERARKRIRARASNLSKGDRHVLVFHQGVLGALWDSGLPSDEGVDADLVEGFDLAFTGHYHMPQKVDDLYVLGAPLDIRFGDELAKRRGYYHVDLEGDLVPRFVSVDYPRFATVRVEVEGDVWDAHDLDAEVDCGTKYVRVVVTGTARDVDRVSPGLREMKAAAEEQGVRHVKLDLRPTRERRRRVDVDPTLSLSSMVRKYAEEFCPEDVDREEWVEVGMRFVEGS